MKKVYTIKTDYEDARLDRWFRKNISQVPQSLIEKNLRKGKIKVNYRKVKSSYKLKKLDSRYGAGWNSIIHNSWNDILGHEYYQKILPNTFD